MQDNVPSLQINPEDVSAIPKVTVEARRAKVWDFRIKGVSVPAIAKVFGVTEKTIYDDLKAIGRQYRDELLKVDAIELIAGNLQWIDEMERIALHEVNQSEASVQKIIDAETGKVTEQRIVDPNRSRFFESALRCREMKLKIMLDTGILPKNKVELFDKLETLENKDNEFEKREERTAEQIKESIEKLMKHGRFMPNASDQQEQRLQAIAQIKKAKNDQPPDKFDEERPSNS